MKIKITEKQLKRINELEVVQYEDNSSDVKNFNTVFDKSKIDITSTLNDLDISYKQESEINVDWSIEFKFDANGFLFVPKVNKVYGFVIIEDGDKHTRLDITNFKISTSELSYRLDDAAYFSYHLKNIEVDVDKKIVIF